MFYKYYSDICVCGGEQVFLPMKTAAGDNLVAYPVIVYDVNGLPIGAAADKEQYIQIWNGRAANRAIGILGGLPGPFSFQLTLRKGAVAPSFVIGDICELLIDWEGDFLVDADGFYFGSMCPVATPDVVFSAGFSDGFKKQLL